MRLALLMALLGDTSTTSHWGDAEGTISLRAEVRSSINVNVEETPLGLMVSGETLHGHDLWRPRVTVTGLPVLAATGVDVWRGEWFVVAGVW